MGIAVTQHPTGQRGYFDADNSAAIVKLNSDGTASLFIGCVDYGMGIRTTMAQIVAEELGISLEDITVTNADTEITPWCLGQWGSRTATIAGCAVLAASRDAKRQLFKIAANMLETSSDVLIARNGKIHVQKT